MLIETICKKKFQVDYYVMANVKISSIKNSNTR